MAGFARNSDPGTSHLAAKLDVTKLEMAVVAAVRKHGPVTAYEVAEILDIPLPSITPRFSPLNDRGAIVRWKPQSKQMRSDPWGGTRWTWVIATQENVEQAAAMRLAEEAEKQAKQEARAAKKAKHQSPSWKRELEQSVLHVVGGGSGKG